MAARFGPRFGAESAFIIAVAVVAALLELSWPAVAAAVFAAWVVVAAVEIVASGGRRPAPGRAERAESPTPALEPPLLPPPPEPQTPVFPEPTADEEPEPPPVLEPAAEPEPAREPAPRPPSAVAEPPPAAPPPRPALVPPPSSPVAPPEQAPATAPPVPTLPTLRPSAARQWNLWELEGRARERAGLDPLRDEEWSFLLMYLREFADADGLLPPDFDPLVRESFAELIRGAG